MTLLLIITLTIIFGILLHINRKSRKPLVPPGPPRLPLIGNHHQFIKARNNLHVYLWQLSTKYGPLIHIKLGSRPVLVISSAKLAKEVLKTQDDSFCNRPELLAMRKLSYNGLDITFSPYSHHWREVRKITTIHLLSLRKIQSFRPIREDEISLMVKRLSNLASSGQVVNLSEMTMNLFITLICRISFGKRYDEHGLEYRRFDKLLQEAQAIMCAPFVSDYFPSLGWVDILSGSMNQLEKTFMKLDTFYQELIDEHLDLKREEKIGEEGDILDTLIKLREHKSSTIDLEWDTIKALLMNIFIGGTNSSTATVVWTMTALMKAPRIMKKLQAEIRGTIKQKAGVDEDDLKKLPYLEAVISEAFRLYSVVPLLIHREAINRCMLERHEVC